MKQIVVMVFLVCGLAGCVGVPYHYPAVGNLSVRAGGVGVNLGTTYPSYSIYGGYGPVYQQPLYFNYFNRGYYRPYRHYRGYRGYHRYYRGYRR